MGEDKGREYNECGYFCGTSLYPSAAFNLFLHEN